MPFPSSVVPTTVQSTLDEYCRGLLTTEINSGRLTQQQAGMLMDEISRLIPQTAHNIENASSSIGMILDCRTRSFGSQWLRSDDIS